MPNVTGVRLDAAEKDLKHRSVPYRILASGGSGAVKNSWTVCETNPAPRTHLETGTTVRLIVAPSCKR